MGLTSHPRRVNEFTAVFARPDRPVLPPRTGMLRGRRTPYLGVSRSAVADEVPALRPRWVDNAGDVAAAAEHEPGRSGDELGGGVGSCPGNDVVIFGADDVTPLMNVIEVDLFADDL